jgi:hypothetical protein
MTPAARLARLRGSLKWRRDPPVPEVWLRAASLCDDMKVAGFVLTAYDAHATWKRTPHEAILDVVRVIKKYKPRDVPTGALRQALTAMREVGLVSTLIPGGPGVDAWLDASPADRAAEWDWLERRFEKEGTPEQREGFKRLQETRRNPMATLQKLLDDPSAEWWTRPFPGKPTPP